MIDTSYTSAGYDKMGNWSAVRYLDLHGFFDRVWTVNPLSRAANAASGRAHAEGPRQVSDRHVFLDGGFEPDLGENHLSAAHWAVSQVRLMFRLAGLVRGEHIDVVRGGDPLYAGLMATIVGAMTRRPVVVRVGGNNTEARSATGGALMPRLMRYPRVEQAVERFVLSRASGVIAANADNLEFAVRSGAPRKSSVVVRYGSLLDARHFIPPADRTRRDLLESHFPSATEDTKIVMYVGRLESVKRPLDVLRVVQYLVQSGLDVVCLLVGDGAMKDEMHGFVSESALSERVVIAGSLPQEELVALLPAADLVVSPHTGRALAEAALAAAPIVAYDIDWQSELIQDGISGYLVPYLDISALSARAEEILSCTDLAQRFGLCARATAMDLLDPDLAVAQERAVYASLL